MVDFTIAIVESDKERLQVMAETIGKIFKVHPFGTGKELLKSIENLDLDLVIIDFNLEDCNGVQLQQEINKDHRSVTTVMMSSMDRSKVVIESMKKRAMDYIYKTDDPERFSDEVCKLVRYLIDERKKRNVETLLKGTDFYPVIKKLHEEKNVDLKKLQEEIMKLKEKDSS